ncbi:MAG: Uma2 family endonuclease [Acidobacteriota bacterium]|nr:Uma2 family endonuclease [Acidobacteriota bacterium]
MRSKLAIHSLTEEEYLYDSEYEHCEYIDGQAVELNIGTKRHSRIQVACVLALGNFLRMRGGGWVYSELHCKLAIDGQVRYRLPDVAVILGDEDFIYYAGAPDFVIEVRSPEDRIADQKRKIDDYFANGCRRAWLIIPEDRSVLVYTPDIPMRVAHEGDVLDLEGILPGFQIEVAEMFS